MSSKCVGELKESGARTWKESVTKKDKRLEALRMMFIGILTGIPLTCVAAYLLVLVMSALALKSVESSLVVSIGAVVTVLLSAVVCFIECKILNRSMNIAINRVKERCKNGVTIN